MKRRHTKSHHSCLISISFLELSTYRWPKYVFWRRRHAYENCRTQKGHNILEKFQNIFWCEWPYYMPPPPLPCTPHHAIQCTHIQEWVNGELYKATWRLDAYYVVAAAAFAKCLLCPYTRTVRFAIDKKHNQLINNVEQQYRRTTPEQWDQRWPSLARYIRSVPWSLVSGHSDRQYIVTCFMNMHVRI